MTDIDTIRAMLDKADVRYKVTESDPSDRGVRPGTSTQIVTNRWRRGEGNLGYMGFLTVFGFDADGNLISVGAWE